MVKALCLPLSAASTLSAFRVSGLWELSAQGWCLVPDRSRSKVRGQGLEGRMWPHRQTARREGHLSKRACHSPRRGWCSVNVHTVCVLQSVGISHIYMLMAALSCMHSHLGSKLIVWGILNAWCVRFPHGIHSHILWSILFEFYVTTRYKVVHNCEVKGKQ